MLRLTAVCGLLAAALLLAAAVVWLAGPADGPPPLFVVAPTAFDLALPPGEHDLVVRVTNPASVPRRIIGLAEG